MKVAQVLNILDLKYQTQDAVSPKKNYKGSLISKIKGIKNMTNKF